MVEWSCEQTGHMRWTITAQWAEDSIQSVCDLSEAALLDEEKERVAPGEIEMCIFAMSDYLAEIGVIDQSAVPDIDALIVETVDAIDGGVRH